MRWDGDKRECVGRFHVAVTVTLVLLAKAMGRDGGERVALMSNLQCVERFVLHVEGQVTLHEAGYLSGMNEFGKSLMRVRERLRAEGEI